MPRQTGRVPDPHTNVVMDIAFHNLIIYRLATRCKRKNKNFLYFTRNKCFYYK